MASNLEQLKETIAPVDIKTSGVTTVAAVVTVIKELVARQNKTEETLATLIELIKSRNF